MVGLGFFSAGSLGNGAPPMVTATAGLVGFSSVVTSAWGIAIGAVGNLRLHLRGVPCLKNPFDLARYSMLIHRQRPGTLVEIGSAAGGSALWFADQCRVHGLATKVISADLQPPGV